MNPLESFVRDLQPRILPLGLEILTQHPSAAPADPHRAFITHRRGGLLAVTHGRWHGDAKRELAAPPDHLFWFPCWPERPNYPIKGKWFSPQRLSFDSWQEAILCALCPERVSDRGIHWDDFTRKIALDRAAKLRDSLRAAVLAANIQALCPNNTKSTSAATAS